MDHSCPSPVGNRCPLGWFNNVHTWSNYDVISTAVHVSVKKYKNITRKSENGIDVGLSLLSCLCCWTIESLKRKTSNWWPACWLHPGNCGLLERLNNKHRVVSRAEFFGSGRVRAWSLSKYFGPISCLNTKLFYNIFVVLAAVTSVSEVIFFS